MVPVPCELTAMYVCEPFPDRLSYVIVWFDLKDIEGADRVGTVEVGIDSSRKGEVCTAVMQTFS